jgi:GTP-binding protein
MVDLVKLTIKAGKGGDGRISFLSNRRTIKGGPDGGDGGNGGSVIAVATYHENTLRDFAGLSVIEAENGHIGGSQNMHGKNEEDLRIKLPVGTRIWRIIDTYQPNEPKRMYKIDRDLGRVERPIEKRSGRGLIAENDGVYEFIDTEPAKREDMVIVLGDKKKLRYGREEYDVVLIGDLTEDGQEVKIARGGRGGRGNETFKSSRNTTPMEAQTGEGAEMGEFIFELQLLADVGLVGLPNAGKSTLLSVLTKATPKIANYPFTTLEPNLGVMQIESPNKEDRRSLVIADIPGLIEGASEGKGLGHEFLRHISRCRTLVFLLTLDDAVTLQNQNDAVFLSEELVKQYQSLEQELTVYAVEHNMPDEMASKRRILLLSKADLLSEDIRTDISELLTKRNLVVRWISSATGFGIDELKKNLIQN